MVLKQIKDVNRIIFLKKFIEEMLLNSYEKHRIEKGIKIEKLKQKFIKSSSEESPQIFEENQETKRKPIIYRSSVQDMQLTPSKVTKRIKPLTKPIPSQYQPSRQIKGIQLPTPPTSNPTKKIDPLIRDSSVQMIECSGPGRNILVKRYGKINTTKIRLSQKEIMDIINHFANEARIPIAGGILKAAIKNLVISAVISEFVGSRFIINKITPYSIIENRK